jgi:hypothetical protein
MHWLKENRKRRWESACFICVVVLLLQGSAKGAVSRDRYAAPIGANHRRPASTLHDRDNGKVVELATGMNYWDGSSWQASNPTFEIDGESFVAERVQHKVRLSGNLYCEGAVRVKTPDGTDLYSTPIGVGLFDAASGRTAIIATIAECSGVMVETNRIIYQNAFSGICADVVYTLDRGSFEQDVVFVGRLDPADYGFPAETTRIQVFTEFYNAPKPDRVRRPLREEQKVSVRNSMVSPDFVDEILGFGEFVLATGRAFSTTDNPRGSFAPVAKEFEKIHGRSFLIESVEYRSIQDRLEGLPKCEQSPAPLAKRSGKSHSTLLATLPSLPAVPRQSPSFGTTALAKINSRSGFVVDYIATIGGSLTGTTIFSGDTTYLVSSAVTCNGPTTLEGGAVFKYKYSSTSPSYIKLNSSLTCRTSSYRPAVFTAVDDDSIGDSLNGYSGSGYTGSVTNAGYASPALWAYYIGAIASNLRFSYCQEGLRVEGVSGSTVSHVQLVNCIRGIVITGSGSGGGSSNFPLTLNNGLFAGVQYPVTVDMPLASLIFYHCTVENSPRILTVNSGSADLAFYNSIFAKVAALVSGSGSLSGSYNGFYNSPQFGTTPRVTVVTPFQAVGAGQYYLTSGTGFRNGGNSNNVAATYMNEVRKKTTYPPVILSNIINSVTVLSPQARRDTDAPDLGFHYDPLDFLVNGLAVTNTTLVLTNGVAIGTYGNSGLWLQDRSQLVSEGTPINRNHFARYYSVQEQATNWGGGVLGNTLSINPYNVGQVPAGAQLRFTDFDTMAAGGYHLYTSSSTWTFSSLTLQDCSFNSGGVILAGPSSAFLSFKNNLFERITCTIGNAPQVSMYNNLLKFGSLTTSFSGSNSNDWTFKDNAFDSVTFLDFGNPVAHGYNAYINMGTNRFYPTNINDKVLTNFTYLAGSLGNYYHSPTSLADAGSRTANLAGLYHYTTRTSQAKETNSVVDIGFHYVATVGGNPADSDVDGLPDYFEDRDGNGNVDFGETAFNNPDSDGDGLSDGYEFLNGLNPFGFNTQSITIDVPRNGAIFN